MPWLLFAAMKLFGITGREAVREVVGKLLPEPLCHYAQVSVCGLLRPISALLREMPSLLRPISLGAPWSACPVCDTAACRAASLQSVLDKCSAQSKVSGLPTVILGHHHHGYAIPLTVAGAEVGGGETAYTFRPAHISEEFLLFMSDSLTVTAASQETMTMLGVRATAVHRPGLPSCSSCVAGAALPSHIPNHNLSTLLVAPRGVGWVVSDHSGSILLLPEYRNTGIPAEYRTPVFLAS